MKIDFDKIVRQALIVPGENRRGSKRSGGTEIYTSLADKLPEKQIQVVGYGTMEQKQAEQVVIDIVNRLQQECSQGQFEFSNEVEHESNGG